MKRRFLLPLLFCWFCISSLLYPCQAQDSTHLRISLLTCSPGDELYSIFGHSAIRVQDSSGVNGYSEISDIVYNYGTFNFDDPGFYAKFIRGKLLYYISRARFDEFLYDYQTSNRTITEQVLDLSSSEKKSVQDLLLENLKEENKFYKYDFFLDNCTTRLRDIIQHAKHPHPILPAVMPASTTFRNAIHQYLDAGKQYWSKLGIDILLGMPTDAVMTTSQQEFLPDNLMKALDSTGNVAIVKQRSGLYVLAPAVSEMSWFTPGLFFFLLLVLFAGLGYSKNKTIQNLLAGLDGMLFFFTGLLGMLLIFMMTATDHSMTKANLNILWAWPTHAVASFFITSRGKIMKRYYLITASALAVVLLSWFFLPQQMSVALIPFILLLLYRSIARYLNIKMVS